MARCSSQSHQFLVNFGLWLNNGFNGGNGQCSLSFSKFYEGDGLHAFISSKQPPMNNRTFNSLYICFDVVADEDDEETGQTSGEK